MLSLFRVPVGHRIPTGLKCFISLALASVIALFPFSSGFAQEGNRDYYAPGTGQNEQDIFKNVELHHLAAGYEELAHKRYDASFAHVEFMLRYFPNHPKALSLLSELCLRWQAPECNTQDAFERAIARNPSASVTYVLQGIDLHRKKRYQPAVESYKKAVELDPASLNAHYNLGLSYIELKQYELANEHAQKAYALGAPFPGLREKLKKAGSWKPASG